MARRSTARPLPLLSNEGESFTFSNIDYVQEVVHRIDQRASGQILADDLVTNLKSSDRDRYLISSLIEEAIRSSQLEGAATTRRVAKEMIQNERAPRTRGEQMILNNYRAIREAQTLALSDEPLTPDSILDLHRIVTEDAIDDPKDAGRMQEPGEERIVVRWNDQLILHRPPNAEELPGRLRQLCDFANGAGYEGFLHPVVRAIVVHFWLAYDHPFVDGNGRTARALFYWTMLREDYWLTQFLSISSILTKAPAKYAESYLHTETDNSDMTYFVVDQLGVIERAIAALEEYLRRKVSETRKIETRLQGAQVLNHRQLTVVGDALRDPSAPFTIKAQSTRHNVTYQPARTDLLGLVDVGLFTKQKTGKRFVFRPAPDLPSQLDTLAADSQ